VVPGSNNCDTAFFSTPDLIGRKDHFFQLLINANLAVFALLNGAFIEKLIARYAMLERQFVVTIFTERVACCFSLAMKAARIKQ
jgi:hypothetical protein